MFPARFYGAEYIHAWCHNGRQKFYMLRVYIRFYFIT